MKTKPTTFAIIVSERGSGKEVELCRVGTNPAAIVEALKLKMLNVLPKGSEKRIQTPRYDSVRYISVSIAIAITLSLSPETTHATKHTASVEQCMTIQQARGAFPNSYLKYHSSHGRRCWFPAGRHARPGGQSKGGRLAERPAKAANGLTLGVESSPSPPLTFDQRWRLR